MIKIKLLKQSTSFSCGPTALKMALSHFGISKSERSLIKLVGAKKGYGCDPDDIVAATKKLGLVSFYKTNSSLDEIRRYLNKNYSIIVDWFSPAALGHYSMIVDLNNKYITLADPDTGKFNRMKSDIFLYRWFELDDYPPRETKNFALREIIVIKRPSNK
jgi:predicted double-glycine peptidase